jgi:hypothetical protein
LGLLILSFCVVCGVATASNFSFTGTFTADDQLELFMFTAPTATTLVQTWGYAGGTNAASMSIPEGGFDPVLSVFDATGGLTSSSPLVAVNDTGGPDCNYNPAPCVEEDSVTGNAWDALITLSTLTPGDTYVLVLTEADNEPSGATFGDGFTEEGNGNFTASEFGCGGTQFCDATPDQRTGNWAVDILGVGTASDITPVPEPGSILLLAGGLAGMALLRRRGKRI